jgi:hypothetical protein
MSGTYIYIYVLKNFHILGDILPFLCQYFYSAVNHRLGKRVQPCIIIAFIVKGFFASSDTNTVLRFIHLISLGLICPEKLSPYGHFNHFTLVDR